MKNIKKYKLTNPKRFINFCLIVVLITTFVCSCYYTNKISVEKMEKNLKISKEIKGKILVPIEEYYN